MSTQIVGSGICLGIQGKCGKDIDNLRFSFLKPIKKVELTRVELGNLPADSLTLEELDEFKQDNRKGATTIKWKFAKKMSKEVSSNWDLSATLTLHSEFTVEAQIPTIGKAGAKAGWEASATASYGKAEKTTKELEWSLEGENKAGEFVDLVAWTWKGSLQKIPFNGVMEITCENGQKYKYDVSGTYNGVDWYNKVEVNTKSDLIKLKKENAIRPNLSTV